MPLTKCPECGKDVSTQATSCPHCAFPVGSTARLPVPPVIPASEASYATAPPPPPLREVSTPPAMPIAPPSGPPPPLTTRNTSKQALPDLEWHYTADGNRFGPVPEDEIIRLINRAAITEKSLLWNKSMPDWQPVLTSKFANLVRDPNVPPPLPGVAISNRIIWVLAFAPLIGDFVAAGISDMSGIPQDSWWYSLLMLILNSGLAEVDARKLKAAGHDVSKMGAAWLVPVYLFKRARILKQSYGYFIVWCVLIGVHLLSENR